MVFITPNDILLKLPALLRQRRVKQGLTQNQLSEKANVSLSVVRKFEQTGHISLESFIKLAFVLDLTDAILQGIEQNHQNSKSIDEILKSKVSDGSKQTIRKRVRNS